MSTNPLISIILPVYNGERYLGESIESCLEQSHRNIELIVVNDCSTDRSLEIARSYSQKDVRVKIISNHTNQRLPASLNKGHEIAKGKYITWTSHDNIFQKDAIKVLLQKLLDQQADISYANYLLIGENGRISGHTILKPIEYLLFSGVIGACFLYKREVYERNHGYKEDLSLVEDFDFWLRALQHSHFTKIDNPGYYYYRYHPDSLTERMKTENDLKTEFLRNLSKVYDELFLRLGLQNGDFLNKILIKKFINNSLTPMEILQKRGVFQDLNTVAGSFKGYKAEKLRGFIIEDLVEIILKDKKYQNLRTFYKLHSEVGVDILNLSARRYIALVKKCIF